MITKSPNNGMFYAYEASNECVDAVFPISPREGDEYGTALGGTPVIMISIYYDGNNVHSVKRLIGKDNMRYTAGTCAIQPLTHDFDRIHPGVA